MARQPLVLRRDLRCARRAARLHAADGGQQASAARPAILSPDRRRAPLSVKPAAKSRSLADRAEHRLQPVQLERAEAVEAVVLRARGSRPSPWRAARARAWRRRARASAARRASRRTPRRRRGPRRRSASIAASTVPGRRCPRTGAPRPPPRRRRGSPRSPPRPSAASGRRRRPRPGRGRAGTACSCRRSPPRAASPRSPGWASTASARCGRPSGAPGRLAGAQRAAVEREAELLEPVRHRPDPAAAVGAEVGEHVAQRRVVVAQLVAADVQVLELARDAGELRRGRAAQAVLARGAQRLRHAVDRVVVGQRHQPHAVGGGARDHVGGRQRAVGARRSAIAGRSRGVTCAAVIGREP